MLLFLAILGPVGVGLGWGLQGRGVEGSGEGEWKKRAKAKVPEIKRKPSYMFLNPGRRKPPRIPSYMLLLVICYYLGSLPTSPSYMLVTYNWETTVHLKPDAL